jgi:hypothetical protein
MGGPGQDKQMLYICIDKIIKGQGLGAGPLLAHDQKSQVGDEIKNQKQDFKKPEERINYQVKTISGNEKPLALQAVN